MLERLIHKVLEEGRDRARVDSAIIQSFFQTTKRIESQAEIDQIVAHFVKNPPDVIHQFPREDTNFPCWAVVLAHESETQNFLGDQGGVFGEIHDPLALEINGPGGWFDTGDPSGGAAEIAFVNTKRYQVLTYSKHPDVTIAFYHLSKLFLARARNRLKVEAELMRINFSGSDILPDPHYIPSHLFARQLTVEVDMVERVVGENPERAFQIRGLHFPSEENTPTETAKVTALGSCSSIGRNRQ